MLRACWKSGVVGAEPCESKLASLVNRYGDKEETKRTNREHSDLWKTLPNARKPLLDDGKCPCGCEVSERSGLVRL